MTKTVVVTDGNFPDFEREKAVAIRHGAAFELADCRSAADVIAVADRADVFLVQLAPITEAALARMPAGALVVRYGIGLDNVDLAAAKRHNVNIAYVPDYATGEVADHTVALILAAVRKIAALDSSVRDGEWNAVHAAGAMSSLSEMRIGFLGFGRIAQEVYARLRPFGIRALVASPDFDAIAWPGVDSADIKELFARSDLVTLHAPLTAATRHIVNAQRLAQMKPTAIIVNTSRGGLVDGDALADALIAGRIGGAALDVFEQEPPPPGARLREAPNLIMTPHAAWYSIKSVATLQALAADEIDRHLGGRPLRCPAPLGGDTV